jgi:hypothetical protein
MARRHEARVGRNRRSLDDQAVGLEEREIQVATHQMPIILRQEVQVSPAPALREEMEQHSTLGAGELLP